MLAPLLEFDLTPPPWPQGCTPNFNANPFVICSAMQASWRNTPMYAGGPLPSTHLILPRLVYWYDPTSVGDNFVIIDPTANNIIRLEGRCEVANKSQRFTLPTYVVWPDFTVIELTSGVLFIYYSA